MAPDAANAKDEFLDRHIPGTSDSVKGLRDRVSEMNTQRALALVRVVLIRGESGTGKNRLAAVLAAHRDWLVRRGRGDDPGIEASIGAFHDRYTTVHLPALPSDLIESELFGHKEGSFTGAVADKSGLLSGDAQDVLLDEIGDATPQLQAKLLSVVETREVRPVGGTADDIQTTSARIILATNKDLEQMVRDGRFREDLYWRIRPFTIEVPPLRKQPENIESIARYLEDELLRDLPEDLVEEAQGRLSPEEIAWAQKHSWPGNVRQLRNAICVHIFERGRRPLRDVVGELEVSTRSPMAHADMLLQGLVDDRIAAVLERGEKPPGTLDELVGEFESQVRKAIVAWYSRTKPDAEMLERVFPEAKESSIRSKISQWRRP